MRNLSLLLLTAGLGFGLFAFAPHSDGPIHRELGRPVREIVLVAACDIHVGTVITIENRDQLIRRRLVDKCDVSPNAILNEEELIGMAFCVKTTAGENITKSIITRRIVCFAAPAMYLYTLKIPYESVGPWVTADKRINVTCTFRDPVSQIVRHINLLSDLLVAEVTDPDSSKSSSGACRCIINRVTLKCSLEDAHWLQTAQDAGGQLRFLIIHERSEPFPIPSDEERYAFFNVTNPDGHHRPDQFK